MYGFRGTDTGIREIKGLEDDWPPGNIPGTPGNTPGTLVTPESSGNPGESPAEQKLPG